MTKRYHIMGLAGVVLAGSVFSCAAQNNAVVRTVTSVGTAGATGNAVSVTVPGYGAGFPAVVTMRANIPRNNLNTTNAAGSAVSITVPGYGAGFPALVATRANVPNNGAFPGGRALRGNNYGNRGDNGNVTNVFNNGGGCGYNGYNGNYYNNSNYLGLPPWYRLNYYTPYASDFENGTAYKNIPTSHAWRGYGIPDGYPGTATYGMPTPQASAQAAYAQAPTDVDFVVGVQRELRKRGFYRGIVNGISDAATRAAIRAFEASAGLPITGVIGFPLLQTLGFL